MTSSAGRPSPRGNAGHPPRRTFAAAILGALALAAAVAADEVPTPAAAGPKAAAVDPVASEELEAAIGRGVAFLLRTQRADGSWGSADSTRGGIDIYAPVPGAHHAFRAGCTALCVSALVESGDATESVAAALDRAEAWLLEHLPTLRRATPDTLYNVWGHAYGIEALALLRRRHAGDAPRRERLLECIRGQVDRLGRYESVNGGWGYYDFEVGSRKPAASPTTFTSATVLLALADARDAGVDVPQRLFDRAREAIRRQTRPDRSYLYGEYLKYRPAHPVNRPAGSLGRSQACNAALRRLGDAEVTDEVLVTWLDRLFARNGWLDLGRKKPIPHESWFAVAGYFFFYGHFYAGECIRALPAAERPRFQHALARLLLPLQEPNGCWWDFPFYDYHEPYGTAFAVRALVRCRVDD